MEPKLAALSIVLSLTPANLVVSGVAMTFGAFAATSPRRAAEIWGSERLHSMAAERQASFLRWYRVFGIVLFLSGCALLVDNRVFSRS